MKTDSITIPCPYCQEMAVFTSSKEIYNGKDYGMIYLCRTCRAYVGVHKGTDRPLGRLANNELREWKKRVHIVFDPIWSSGKMPRSEAYKTLANKLEIPRTQCHIGMFDVDLCKRSIEIIKGEKL